MFINNKQKIEDNQKEINDNNDINIGNNKLKYVFNKQKIKKPYQNFSLLPKIRQQDGKITIIKKDQLKKPFIRSSSDIIKNNYNNNININQKDKEKEDYKEELLIIKNLWEELGVTQEYQEQFNNFLGYENLRKVMFIQEKENLQKFRYSLMKLRKEILNRENNIESLIKIIRAIESQNEIENLLKEVINIIKSLRLNAVNIVFYMQKIRELSFYYYFQGKWDLTKIRKDYLFNNNYLLKMKDDLNFLRNTILKNYIEMNNSPIDAFLINCSLRNKDSKNKIVIPLTEELSKIIEQCKYTIIQDQLLDNIYNKNRLSQFINRANSGKIRIRKFSAYSPKHKQNINNFMSNRELNSSLNKYQHSNKIDLSKTVYLLRNDNPIDYNNLFLNNNNINNQIPSINTNLKEARKLFEQKRLKIRNNEKNNYLKNNINNYIHNYDSPKRIIVEHDILKNKAKNTTNENFSSLENIDNLDNIENKTNKYDNSNTIKKDLNDLGNKKIDIILEENDKLRKDNEEIKKELENSRKRMENNDKLRKSLEKKIQKQKEEMEKVSNNVEEIKQQLIKEKKELEEKLKEEKEKNKKIEKINKEMEEKIKNQMMINKEIELKIIEKNENKNESEVLEKKNDESKEKEYILNSLKQESKFSEEEKKESKENINAITNNENEDSVNQIKKSNESNINNDIENNNYNNSENTSIKNKEKNNDDKILDEINNISEYELSQNNKFKVEYYKGNISSFINELKSSISLEIIDEKLKTTFDLTNEIYNEESYLIGQYPQIIICKPYEEDSKICGFCNFYYQNTTKNENIIKINFICAINIFNENNDNNNDIFEQFTTMINFIKKYVIFNELYITLYYNKTILENQKVKYFLEKNILEYFQDKMKFKWACVVNKNGQKRIQQLCYNNETKIEEKNNLLNNEGYIDSETISLLSFINKDNNTDDKIKLNLNNYKYMNNLPIYSLLSSQNELLTTDFKENKNRIGSFNLIPKKNSIINIFYPENKNLEELKSKLNENNENIIARIEDSLFSYYYNAHKENQIIYSFGLFKMDLNIFFKNILNVKINNYYYNRISSNKIEIIKDTKNDCIFYNIPCLNKINNILIFEINEKMRKFLIDNNSNIYELFINYYIQLQKENTKKIMEKNIYIPSFKFETHLQAEKASKEINNISIYQNIENIPMKIGTIDEFLKINFNKERVIQNQIKYEIDEPNDRDIIIKDNFILAIINNYTEIKFPLFQLMYILKEAWIKVETELE